MNNIQEKLLQKIKDGEVKMVPRWHFMLKGLLWGAATVTVALVAVYLLSFVLFALHESGLIFAPFLGPDGVMLFIVSTPWLILGVVALFLFALYVLVSKYSFSYKKPLVYSMVGVVLLVIAVSAVIKETNFHGRAGEFMDRHSVPGFAPMYRDLDKRPPKDITKGTISALTETSFTLTTEAGEEYVVGMNEKTKLPRDEALEEGDAVMVFGPLSENTIKAFGVRFDDGTMPPPPEGGGDRPPKPPKDKDGDFPPPEFLEIVSEEEVGG